MQHADARPIVADAVAAVLGPSEPLSVIQVAQAVAALETRYGRAWRVSFPVYNWGAIQASRPPCDPAASFLYTDKRPDGRVYSVCFRRYSNDDDGAEDLIRVLYAKRPTVLAAARAGDLRAVAVAMRATRYYEGIGATEEQRIEGYARGLAAKLDELARALGERPAATLDGPGPGAPLGAPLGPPDLPVEPAGVGGWPGLVVLGLGALVAWRSARARRAA